MALKTRIFKIVAVVSVTWTVVAAMAPRMLIVSAPLASADAIVVLSGSSTYVERAQKAAQLFHEGRAPRVLLTDDHTRGGWSTAQQRNPFFVERAREELIKAGVSAEKIQVVPGIAAGTYDEALIIRDFVVSEKLRTVLVVTSAYHSRRALRTLRQTFAETGAVVALEFATPATPQSVFWWLRPEGWRTVGSEYVKLIYYWFKYD